MKKALTALYSITENVNITNFRGNRKANFWVYFGKGYVNLKEYILNQDQYKSWGEPIRVFIDFEPDASKARDND